MVCLGVLAKGYSSTSDSLRKLIGQALKNASKLPDTITIHRINELADETFDSFPDSTYYYGNLEIQLSKRINYLKGVADGTVQIAAVNTFRGDYEVSAKNYTIALNLYKKINNSHGVSECYVGLGRVQDYLGNYDEAIHWYNLALPLCLKSKNDMDAANCYIVMGVTYDNKGDFSKALECYFKSLIIDIKNKD